jgi:hypothetical protein
MEYNSSKTGSIFVVRKAPTRLGLLERASLSRLILKQTQFPKRSVLITILNNREGPQTIRPKCIFRHQNPL